MPAADMPEWMKLIYETNSSVQHIQKSTSKMEQHLAELNGNIAEHDKRIFLLEVKVEDQGIELVKQEERERKKQEKTSDRWIELGFAMLKWTMVFVAGILASPISQAVSTFVSNILNSKP